MHEHYYKHNRPGDYQPREDAKTYAFELPAYDLVEQEIVKMITDEAYVGLVTFPVGVAKLHKNDRYVKATGRDVAEKNMVMSDFAIRRVQILPRDNEILVNLVGPDDLYIRMVLRKSYRNIRIIAAFFEYEK